jgi:hypothetical protein
VGHDRVRLEGRVVKLLRGALDRRGAPGEPVRVHVRVDAPEVGTELEEQVGHPVTG